MGKIGRPPADGRDTKPALKATVIRDVLASAASAIPRDILHGHRLVLPGDWPELRRIALLRDEPRRACLLSLLVDEGARLAQEGQ